MPDSPDCFWFFFFFWLFGFVTLCDCVCDSLSLIISIREIERLEFVKIREYIISVVFVYLFFVIW